MDYLHQALLITFLTMELARASDLWTQTTSADLDSSDRQLLHESSGLVGAGNYTYFSVENIGHIIVSLKPRGPSDPDLYASSDGEKPTVGTHLLCSATCGDERLHIPHSWARPVIVAVYGGPVPELSPFHIRFERVRKLEQMRDSYDWYEKHFLHYPEDQVVTKSEKRNNQRKGQDKHQTPNASQQDDEESVLWTIFIGILRIIVDILL